MMTQISTRDALALLISRAGSQDTLAANLGVSQGAVSQWLNGAGQMPGEHVIPAERLYGVSRHDLRPDLYPREEVRDRGSPDRFHGVDRHASQNRVAA